MTGIKKQSGERETAPKHSFSFSALFLEFCDPAGARTQDPNIKSVVLYQLSYGIK
jgi:hypothetical protein